ADRKFRFHKYREAEELYLELYSKNQALEGSESLLLKIADCHREQKKYEEAIQSYDKILKDHSRSPVADDALYEKAVILGCHKKQRAEGLGLLRELLATYPTSDKGADAQYLIGYLYLTLNETSRAKEAFNEVISSYPTSPRREWAMKDLEVMGR
ncbi:MAG: hypothetical protein COZ56_18765, partial [Armatimonadetes bacterium CG_4_8_14_3_um_filter_58_9]